MLELIAKGGPVMGVLFLCSVVGLYIVVYKVIFLRLNTVDQALLMEQIKNKLITLGKEQTILSLRSHRDIPSVVLSMAIRLSHLPREDLQEGLKETTLREVPKLERHMGLLSSIITVSPILGLLGTVIGLVDIFNVISGGGIGDATAMSGGIAKALITTVAGLSIAIPFIFAYNHLSAKIDGFMLDLERMMNELLNFCRSSEGVKP